MWPLISEQRSYCSQSHQFLSLKPVRKYLFIMFLACCLGIQAKLQLYVLHIAYNKIYLRTPWQSENFFLFFMLTKFVPISLLYVERWKDLFGVLHLCVNISDFPHSSSIIKLKSKLKLNSLFVWRKYLSVITKMSSFSHKTFFGLMSGSHKSLCHRHTGFVLQLWVCIQLQTDLGDLSAFTCQSDVSLLSTNNRFPVPLFLPKLGNGACNNVAQMALSQH